MLALSKLKDQVRSVKWKVNSLDNYKVLHIQEAYFDLFRNIGELNLNDEDFKQGLISVIEQQCEETIRGTIEGFETEETEIKNSSSADDDLPKKKRKSVGKKKSKV